MDKKTMKNRIKSFKLWVLSCAMLIAGVQSASASLTGCEGTVYLKLPDSWTAAYSAAGGQFVAFSKSTTYTGWYEISSTKIGGTNGATEFFISKALNDYGQQGGITKTTIGANVQFDQGKGFSCADFGTKTNELWIQPDFSDPTKPLVQGEPPDVKYFYVFLPDDKIWKSSDPIIVENGKERKMNIDENCGWYYRRYVNESLPTEVIIRRDDDTELKYAIGMEGEAAYNNGDAATPIDLEGMFDNFKSDATFAGSLFFVADEKKAAALPSDFAGWYVDRPDIHGNCSYSLAAIIYDTDASLHPAFSCYSAGGEGCQTGAQGVDQMTAVTAINACIGVTTGLVESTLDKATKKPKLTTKGKKCFLDDKYFNQMFNYTAGVNELTCFDMPFSRATDGKWEFNSDDYVSPGLKIEVPGGFYPAEATDALKLEEAKAGQTPVPAARTKRWAQGPAYYGAALRAIDPATEMPVLDVYCNGPGWKKGFDCEGVFGDGGETETRIRDDLGLTNADLIIGWDDANSAPEGWPLFLPNSETKATATATSKSSRWESKEGVASGNGGRNQHFCFESHANFRFKPGLKFNFRGDDDIWVFIDNKLAVDLGGTHLAAPGYVDLDTFMPNAKTDSTYDIDIFFCDRRTTMSNVRIKTNMFIEQNTGIEYEGLQNLEQWKLTGDNEFELCFTQSGAGNCAAQVGAANTKACGDAIKAAGHTIAYQFTRNDPTGSAPGSMIVSEDDFAADPVQLEGIIDVTNPGKPVINEKKLMESLSQGTYYLRIRIDTEIATMSWTIKGSVGLTSRNAVVEADGKTGPEIPFVSSAMASDNKTTADGMIRLLVAPIVDPCAGNATCTTPLKLNPSVGDEYSLVSTNAKAIIYKMVNGELVDIGSKTQKIGSSGVDTIYVTVPFTEFELSDVEKVTVYVKQSSLKAELTFFTPKIVFVTSATSLDQPDMTKDLEKMKSEMVDFYILALDQNNNPCTTCSFDLNRGSQTSPGLKIVTTADGSLPRVENGRATITVYSELTYERGGTNGVASLHLTGAAPNLMSALYPNLIFSEPPVPLPKFADIFDVHGAIPASAMNIPSPYFSAQNEYLDGIADSIVIYYAREFHKDSLPGKIAIFWEDDTKDSVLFEGAEIAAGAYCGVAAGASADTLCAPKITLGGKKLSKKVKTDGIGKIKSWATFLARGQVVTKDYSCSIYDRIAPIIIGARATNEVIGGIEYMRLKITFSEKIAKTTEGIAAGNDVFSFYINNSKTPDFAETLPLAVTSSVPDQAADKTVSLLYSKSGVFPQSGDYIHFRSLAGVGLVTDQSDYAAAVDASTHRPADDVNFKWNVAPGYDPVGSDRLPSPWALVEGEVKAYAARIVPPAMGGIPKTPSETAALEPFEIFAYDATKTEDDFRNEILAGQGEFANYAFIPHGWFVKSDLGSLIESDTTFVNANKKNVFFDYDLRFFTNLGSHVASLKGRIYCDDDENMARNKKYYFGGAGHNCVENRKNFFIVWNMKSDKNRLVGTGAYISKLNSYVQLDNFGKKNKIEKTEVWGVRHTAKTPGSYPTIKVGQ